MRITGLGLAVWTAVLLATLKLTGQLAWSWVLVISPLWFSGIVLLIFTLIKTSLFYHRNK